MIHVVYDIIFQQAIQAKSYFKSAAQVWLKLELSAVTQV